MGRREVQEREKKKKNIYIYIADLLCCIISQSPVKLLGGGQQSSSRGGAGASLLAALGKFGFSNIGANQTFPLAFLIGIWMLRLDLQQPFCDSEVMAMLIQATGCLTC